MKYFAAFLPIAALIILPATADAHAHYQFVINGQTYEFVVGSLNEPITVDDKTGVDFRVTKIGADGGHGAGEPVTGLEETLKVEMIAGDVKKVTDLSPVYNTPGAYKNAFYPTIATTLSYRIFGTIADIPFDHTFTCTPAGHVIATEDTNEVAISEGVTRILKTGSYGCPSTKEDLGFPERSVALAGFAAETQDSIKIAKTKGMVGIGLGAFALLLAGYAVIGRKHPTM